MIVGMISTDGVNIDMFMDLRTKQIISGWTNPAGEHIKNTVCSG